MKIFSYGIILVLWLASIILTILYMWWYLLVILFTIHILEAIFIGTKVGRENGRSTLYSFIMTTVYGFIWWLPIKKSIEASSK